METLLMTHWKKKIHELLTGNEVVEMCVCVDLFSLPFIALKEGIVVICV